MDTKLPDAPEMKLHFLDYWRIIRLRKTVILLVFLLVVITTMAVTFWLPKTYASSVRIKVAKDEVIGSIENKQSSFGYDPFWLQTEFEVIQSSSVLTNVVSQLGLTQKWAERYGMSGGLTVEQTFEILKKQISVRQSHNTSLIEIWVYSEDVNEAPEIANTIAQAYRDYRKNLRSQVRDEGIDSLRKQLEKQDEDIKAVQKVVNDMRREINIPDFDNSAASTATLDEETMRTFEQHRIAAKAEYEKASALLVSVSKYNREELRNSLSTAYPYDSLLNSFAEKLAAGQLQLTALLKDYTPEHAEVKKAQALVDEAQTHLDDRIDGVLRGLKSLAESKKQEMDKMTAEVEAARLNKTTQTAKYGPYFDEKRNLETLQRIKEALVMKIRAEIIESAQPTTTAVEITDPANVMLRPVRPRMTLNLALGIVVGLLVGVGLAFFIEYLDTSVKTIDDVERALQAPVVGVIPQNPGVLLEEGHDTPQAEAYRVLRTNILFSRKDESLNTISVLSGGAGEGKSTTLINLATAFAQNGSRCLVVDSDLRRPTIHKILHLSNNIGLTNYLLQQNRLEEVIQTTRLATLDFMPSGKLPSSSMGILSSEKMKELIRELKQRYDFVFFDAPPVLGVSDASILASEMDMILQVVQYRRYPQPMTLRAKQMIQKVGGNLIGIVLNNINMSQYEGYYYSSSNPAHSNNGKSNSKIAKPVNRAESTKV